MEEVIQIVIFIAFVGIAIVRKYQDTHHKNSKESIKRLDSPIKIEKVPTQESTTSSIFSTKLSQKENYKQDSPLETYQTKQEAKKNNSVHIKTHSEARKAFIYSVIINRKYK